MKMQKTVVNGMIPAFCEGACCANWLCAGVNK